MISKYWLQVINKCYNRPSWYAANWVYMYVYTYLKHTRGDTCSYDIAMTTDVMVALSSPQYNNLVCACVCMCMCDLLCTCVCVLSVLHIYYYVCIMMYLEGMPVSRWLHKVHCHFLWYQ